MFFLWLEGYLIYLEFPDCATGPHLACQCSGFAVWFWTSWSSQSVNKLLGADRSKHCLILKSSNHYLFCDKTCASQFSLWDIAYPTLLHEQNLLIRFHSISQHGVLFYHKCVETTSTGNSKNFLKTFQMKFSHMSMSCDEDGDWEEM